MNENELVHGFCLMSLAGEDVFYGLGGFFLCCGGDMGVGVQDERGGEVTVYALQGSPNLATLTLEGSYA